MLPPRTIREKFADAVTVDPSWGARPWHAYRGPAPGPVVPGAQPKICVVKGEDGIYRQPVDERDTPEFRSVLKGHYIEALTEKIVSKPAGQWLDRAQACAYYLHLEWVELSEQENEEVLGAVIERVLQRPEMQDADERAGTVHIQRAP